MSTYSTFSLAKVAVLAGLASFVVHASAQTVIYVDASATGLDNGTSWENAYTDVAWGAWTAQSGDQVWVAHGRYFCNIELKDGVALYGGFAGDEDAATFDLALRDIVSHETVLDGFFHPGSVVRVAFEATGAARIDGFTITNGKGTLSGNFLMGGGLYVFWSSPTIVNNKIIGNGTASNYFGGGLLLYDSGATIMNNSITGNSASLTGGGLYVNGGSPTIIGNRIVGNVAQSQGGGLDLINTSATIMNNAIAGNSAIHNGGGVRASNSAVIMVNNTIVGNSAFSGPGGALYLDNSSSALTIANSIIAFNSPGIYRTQGYEPTLLHNCVYGNAAYDYSGMADPTDTNGNISVDPLFAHGPGPGPDGVWGTGDDSDRLRLLSASPCIDAGDNAEVSTDVDLDGQTRIAAGNGNGVAIVDMGAYEYQPVPLPGDMDGDGDVDLLDHELWLGCLRGPSIPYSAGCHVADFDGNGVVDLADSANLFRMLAP